MATRTVPERRPVDGRNGTSRQAAFCHRCRQTVVPRGEKPPLFCANCGYPLAARSGRTAEARPGPATGDAAGCGVAEKCSGKANAALVCGILSFFLLGPVLGLIAVGVGLSAQREIDDAGGTLHGKRRATAGIVLGAIGAGLGILRLATLAF